MNLAFLILLIFFTLNTTVFPMEEILFNFNSRINFPLSNLQDDISKATDFLSKGTKIYKLDNGLTVILKQYPKLPLVSIQAWINAGSIYETDQNNGISHFLEHLVFKGTKKYKCNEISSIIEKYGAILNAGTSKEFTMYFTDIPKEGLVDALDIIKELIFEATFPPEELEKERKVVIEEIKRFEDKPENVLYEKFNSILFTHTPYKFRVIGTTEVITSLSREEIINYYHTFYQPRNVVLSICGDIDFSEIMPLIEQTWGKYSNKDKFISKPDLKEPIKPYSFSTQKHKVQHTYFLCGFLGPEINDELQYAGDVLSIILGDGMSSRLYKSLREEKKLVYAIDCGFYTQIGPSIFYISGVCDRKNLEKVIEEIKNELKKIVTEGVSENELNKAKQTVITHWYFGNETVHSQASNLAWWYMFKSIDELKTYLAKVDKVTNIELQKFLSTYGSPNNLTIFALEP